ncbi:sugar nucleotide-binding protein [Patiriisocius sp. Uisw_017]|jgi:dTDP-4-dehydrorhamnose reductase|uniref:sugar nucleotide-binding protein n=1 Tax=Patiriisocius sp. Uisw_017 TaxID=3230968 RepID=UPI0039ED8C40
MKLKKHTVLILGASGYIGNVIYRELCHYFDTCGTYASASETYKDNQAFFKYTTDKQNIDSILAEIKPTIIISAIGANRKNQLPEYKKICAYVAINHHSRFFLLSSVAVFDGTFEFPSYENKRPISVTDKGKFLIAAEKLVQSEIPAQAAILRLPLVLGNNSPIITQLRQATKNHANFEVYPDTIVSVTTAFKIAQQIHYLANRSEDGIFHLSSEDVIHHHDLFAEICEKYNGSFPIFKNVYGSNEDRFLAILPKLKKLPKTYRITVAEVIENCILEDIVTLRN